MHQHSVLESIHVDDCHTPLAPLERGIDWIIFEVGSACQGALPKAFVPFRQCKNEEIF